MTTEHDTINTTQSDSEAHAKDKNSSTGSTSMAKLVTLPDPFDPSHFAVNSSVMSEIGVAKELVACPVRKPNKQEFVRVNPDGAYHLRACILELKDERETYLVTPDVAAMLPGETKTVDLRLAASRQGAIFIWPVPVPASMGVIRLGVSPPVLPHLLQSRNGCALFQIWRKALTTSTPPPLQLAHRCGQKSRCAIY